MANSNSSDGSSMMNDFVSQIVSQFGTFFEKIGASRSYPIEDFPNERTTNYLYVLYSINGMPLYAGAMLDSMNKREQNRIAKEVQAFGASGFVSTFKIVEFGSEDVARHFERLVRELFSGALPLVTSGAQADEAQVASAAAVEAPPVKRRRRGRPKKSQSAEMPPIKRRRGRPKKSEAATEAPVKRRPGRPKKSEATAAESTAPKRRGRPRKNARTAAPAKRGPSRPKKSEAAAAEKTAPKRRGRPRKNAAKKTTGRRPGRPRKVAQPTATPTEA